MTYTGNDRSYNDADSHVMAVPGWLESYAPASVRELLRPMDASVYRPRHLVRNTVSYDRNDMAAVEANLLVAKEWDAYGSTDSGERRRALDLFGFDRQLVLSSFAVQQFYGADVELLYGGTAAHNRAIGDFCSGDQRLYAVGYLPLVDPRRDVQVVEDALASGCRAFQVPKEPLGDQSPSHPDFDPVWARLAETRAPFILHVGPDGRYFHPAFRNNGKSTAEKPSVDGDGVSILSKDFLAIYHSAETFLTTMIFDGVLERFPTLRGGSIELGSAWLVAWMRRIDMIQSIFTSTEPYLGTLPLKGSEYIQRQLRFTPYTTEPVAWIIDQVGVELLMFSTDFPHPEGGRNPLKRFREHLDTCDEATKEAFYYSNFMDLVGEAPVRPAPARFN
jgi:uncharacterized protein